MHILLLEVSLSGHHSIYLERTALAYLNAGHSVTIALPIAIPNDEVIRSNLALYRDIAWVEYSPLFKLDNTGLIGLVTREYQVRKIFGRVYRDVHAVNPVDYVFLPYIDYCLYALGLMGSPFGVSRFGGICMRPAFHYHDCEVGAPRSKMDYVKRYLFYWLLNRNNLSELFTIDELLIENTRSRHPLRSSKLKFIADPVDDPLVVNVVHVRDHFETPVNAKVILVYGALDERKGIYQLLDTLEMEQGLDDWYVWLIGGQSSALRRLLNSERWTNLKKQKKIYSIDRFVDQAAEQMAFGACDVVWVGYIKHYGMSGVLVHAGIHSKPVIAREVGLIGWYAKNAKLGCTITDDNNSVASSLRLLLNNLVSISMGKNGYQIFKKNTWKNFEICLVENE